jgi:hypothetical protein
VVKRVTVRVPLVASHWKVFSSSVFAVEKEATFVAPEEPRYFGRLAFGRVVCKTALTSRI